MYNSTQTWLTDMLQCKFVFVKLVKDVKDILKQAENGLQSQSTENGKTAVWHYGLKLQ